jgi:MtN3 and saliva related transmembrane protein
MENAVGEGFSVTPFQDMLGLIAGTLTTISFVPQVWRIWTTRSANDISWGMFIIFALGNIMWFSYGWTMMAMPILISSGVTLVLAVAIMVMKWKFSPSAVSRKQ